MKSGIRPWRLSRFARLHPRRWRPTVCLNLRVLLRVMKEFVAPRWPAKEMREQKSRPDRAPPWCCGIKILHTMWLRWFSPQNTVAETQKQLSYYWTMKMETSMRCANIQLWVCPSFSYKWLSSGFGKLVSTNVCPLLWLQQFPPDCIRTCVEKRIIRLQKDSAALALLDGNARLCCLHGTLVF